ELRVWPQRRLALEDRHGLMTGQGAEAGSLETRKTSPVSRRSSRCAFRISARSSARWSTCAASVPTLWTVRRRPLRTCAPFIECTTIYLRSEEHTSELQSRGHLVCRLLLEKINIAKPPATRA